MITFLQLNQNFNLHSLKVFFLLKKNKKIKKSSKKKSSRDEFDCFFLDVKSNQLPSYKRKRISRYKHNLSERKRRKKVNDLFQSLRQVLHSPGSKVPSLLYFAIDTIYSLEKKVHVLEKENKKLKSLYNNNQFQMIQKQKENSSNHISKAEMNITNYVHSTTTTTTNTSKQKDNHHSFLPFFQTFNFFFFTNVPMLLTSLSGQIIDCNHYFVLLLGYSKEILLKTNMTTFEITQPKLKFLENKNNHHNNNNKNNNTRTLEPLPNSFSNSNIKTIEMKFIHQNGNIILTITNWWINLNYEGFLKSMFAIIEPISSMNEL